MRADQEPQASLVQCSTLLTALGFKHGFSLRFGGASDPPYDSLNLGRAVGDDPHKVEENHGRFAAAVGYRSEALYEVTQVHGRAVHVCGSHDLPQAVRAVEADALVAGPGGAAVGVRVADCVPLLLADGRRGAVAAVHAGWRGAVARVAQAAIESLEQTGTRREDLVAVLGPHIRVEAFEVGPDVARQIAAEAHGADVVQSDHEKPHVDLAKALTRQLQVLGLRAEQIEDVGGCTYSEPGRYFSYRRDGKRSGRHLAAIVSR